MLQIKVLVLCGMFADKIWMWIWIIKLSKLLYKLPSAYLDSDYHKMILLLHEI